jgi:hypothetical protein
MLTSAFVSFISCLDACLDAVGVRPPQVSSVCCLHQSLPGNSLQRRSSLNFRVHVLTGRRMTSNQLNSELVLLIPPRHGPHRKHFSQQLYCSVTQMSHEPRREHQFPVIHWCVLGIYCGIYLAMAVVLQSFYLANVYTLQCFIYFAICVFICLFIHLCITKIPRHL